MEKLITNCYYQYSCFYSPRNSKMEVIEQDDGSLAVISNIPDADGVTLQYAWDVVGQAGNLPLDIAQSVMTSYSTVTSRAKCSGKS